MGTESQTLRDLFASVITGSTINTTYSTATDLLRSVVDTSGDNPALRVYGSGTSGSGSSGSSGTNGASGTSGENGLTNFSFYNYIGVTSGTSADPGAGYISAANTPLQSVNTIWISVVDADGKCHNNTCEPVWVGQWSWFNNVLYFNLSTITLQSASSDLFVDYTVTNYNGQGLFMASYQGSNYTGKTFDDLGPVRIYTRINGTTGSNGTNGTSGINGVAGDQMTTMNTITDTYTGLTTDRMIICSGSSYSVYLPVAQTTGHILQIKNEATGPIVVKAQTGEYIDNYTGVTLSNKYDNLTIVDVAGQPSTTGSTYLGGVVFRVATPTTPGLIVSSTRSNNICFAPTGSLLGTDIYSGSTNTDLLWAAYTGSTYHGGWGNFTPMQYVAKVTLGDGWYAPSLEEAKLMRPVSSIIGWTGYMTTSSEANTSDVITVDTTTGQGTYPKPYQSQFTYMIKEYAYATNGKWDILSKYNDGMFNYKTPLSITVGSPELPTLKATIDWLSVAGNMSGNTTLLLIADNEVITDTITIDLPFNLAIKGGAYDQNTLSAGAGLTNKPMFIIKSDVSFVKVIFDGSTLASYGTLSTENCFNLDTNGVYVEIKDFLVTGFYNGIYQTSNAEVWTMEGGYNNCYNAGYELNTNTSGATFISTLNDWSADHTGYTYTGIKLTQGHMIYISSQNDTSQLTSVDTFIDYDPDLVGYTDFTIIGCIWNNIGTFRTGFDFATKQDADIVLLNNTGDEDMKPHAKYVAQTNTSGITLSTTYQTIPWTPYTTYSKKISFDPATQAITYLPTHKTSLVMWISGAITASNQPATVTLSVVKNGNFTGTTFGNMSVYIDQNSRAFNFSTNVYLDDVLENETYVIAGRCSNGTEAVILQDLNWLILST